MKEIQAYLRPSGLQAVVGRLENAGAHDLTVSRVEALGALAQAEDDRLRLSRRYPAECSEMAKLEVICPDADADRLVNVIHEASGNGGGSNGRIFVLNIERVVGLEAHGKGAHAV